MRLLYQRVTNRPRWSWRWLPTALWLLLWVGAWPTTQVKAESPLSWKINADSITYDKTQDEYTAEGNVRIEREGRILTADWAQINQTSREARAEGNVTLLSGADTMTGERLDFHLDSEKAQLYKGKLFLAENHMYLTGSKIDKTGPQTYVLKDVTATSCDGDNPDWKITGKDLKVTIEGYAFAKHAAFWARQMPLLYTPYMAFPVKLKRQTGLLMPEFGFSDRKGYQYLQPFFWAISQSTDATFYLDYMSERGIRPGIEYRYVAGESSRGTLMADGFNDREVDDGQGDNSLKWGYNDGTVDYPRPNDDRYWFRAKADHALPGGMIAKLDLDLVSDQDYLKEFQNGFNGFEETRSYYLETFGRDIDDYNDPIRLNRLNVNRTWSGYALNMDARWNDNVIARRQLETDNTLQYLPQITFDGTKKKIADSVFYFDLLTEYSHLFREEGQRGHRADLYPRVYYPTRLLSVLSVEPSAGLRQTAWHLDDDTTTAEGERDDYYRAIYDLALKTSTDVYRVFDINMAGCDRLKHAIKPEVIYTYVPDDDQEDLPDFDALDRIEAENLITYSITNTFVARSQRALPEGAKGSRNDYTPFLRVKLSQQFDIDVYNETVPAGMESQRQYQPFSDVLAELDITPGRYVYLDGDALWSPYDGQFHGYNTTARLWDDRGDNVGLNYRFTRETVTKEGVKVPPVQSIDLFGTLALTARWRLRGKYERDMENDRLIEVGGGILYQAQCWGIGLDYTEEEDYNRSIQVMVKLLGIGSFGE